MNALYGYILAGALLLAGIAGFFGYQLGHSHAATAARAQIAEAENTVLQAEVLHLNNVRETEQKLAAAQTAIAEAYEKGKKDAEATAADVVADLNAGVARLRGRWAGCETERLSLATALAAEPDAAARDRNESAGRIVRAAAECDAQVRGLQSLLTSERAPAQAVESSSRR